MDPQLRMMLEVVHEAIVDAGTAHFSILSQRYVVGKVWNGDGGQQFGFPPCLNPDIRKRVLAVLPYLYGLWLITTLYKHPWGKTGEKTDVFTFYISWSGFKFVLGHFNEWKLDTLHGKRPE